MRALLLSLALLNLLFFGWSHWVDAPPPPAHQGAYIPALTLAPGGAAAGAAAADAASGAPVAPVAAGATAPAAQAATSAAAPAPADPAATPAPATATSLPATAAVPAAAGAAASGRCATLGPLADAAAVAAVRTALQARNLAARERQAAGQVADGYWVYIDNLRDPDARQRAMRKLARANVRDAAALADNGQVSVGLFNEKAGADKRAAAVRAAGFAPVIAARTRTVSQLWLDVTLAPDMPLPSVNALVAGLNLADAPEWSTCPAPGAG